MSLSACVLPFLPWRAEDLEKAKASLKGSRRADLKAQKLHVLDRQTRQLELQLDNTHRALALAMDSVEEEERRFARLVGAF